MRLDTRPESSFGKTSRGIEGLTNCKRTIILSEIKSDNIFNILDLFFNVGAGGTNEISPSSKKTRVMVINNSEVYGSYHGFTDTRNRGVYIHYGMCDCAIDEVTGETPIIFTDVDYNLITDKPSELIHGKSWQEIGDVKVSYDRMSTAGTLVRTLGGKTREIYIPTPEFYDEKDMVLITGEEESYANKLSDINDQQYFMSYENYYNSLFRISFNNLIDTNTTICKLNITVNNLSTRLSTDNNINDTISNIVSLIKYSLEKSGFSSAEIILSGNPDKGYNITNLRSYLNLSPIEKRSNFMLLCNELNDININQYGCEFTDIALMLNINYSNIKVNIIDDVDIFNGCKTTDTNIKEISDIATNSQILVPEFRDSLARAI